MSPKMLYLTVVTLSVFGLWQVTEADEYIEQTEDFLNKYIKSTDRLMIQAANENNQGDDDEIYANEHLEDMRQKRDVSQSAYIRRERAIHREGGLKIHLVSFHHADGSRYKRATYNTTTETWPHLIPYKFDYSYSPDLRPKVARIMADISDHVCVKWVEEPDFDPDNNNYPTNAYLRFVGSDSICGTFLGQGDGHGPRNIKTCTQYYSIVHELLHTLGVIHEQQGPLSLNHLTLVLDNILDGYWGGTYKLHNYPSKIETSEFDGSSIMMYSRRSFSKNGLDILLPFRDEEFDINYDRQTSLDNVYMELNAVYKCNAIYCNNTQVDCGLGYHTRVKGVCQCVCPEGFDPAHNCQQLEDETSGPQTWPDVPFSLYASASTSCPAGFSSARFDITGTRNPVMIGDPFFSTSKTTNYYMCTRDDSTGNSDMNLMPLGTYCVVKPLGVSCNGAFSLGGFKVKSTLLPFDHSGEYGDWPYTGDVVDMQFCCRDDRDWFYPMVLPRQSAFRLISEDGRCNMIKGMRMEIGRIAMFNQAGSKIESFPQSWLTSYYLVHNFCTYTPAIYGCNQDITLDASNSIIDIKTPGFESGFRESNKRCLYNFNIPKGSRVKVTFNTFDIETNDLFSVRRFNKWARPLYEFDNHFVKQFISEKEFLFLEYWSGATSSGRSGIHLTAELLTGNCFEERGRSYKGEKAVSELFEPCLPWTEAANCDDFPYAGSEAVDLMSASNHCRNPGGDMERPWCHVSVEMGLCKRSYCDVCNNLDDGDRITDCASLQFIDPDFCTSSLQRFQCAGTCGLNLNVPAPSLTGTCSTPNVPSDGTPTVPLEASYSVGDFVSFDCDIRITNEDPTQIECTENGWPNLQSACTECPLGWIPYGNRCFFYMPEAQFVDSADDECALKGGRIFVVRNSSDVEIIRNFKQTSTIAEAPGGSWLNIELVSGQWVIRDNHTLPAPYLNWASNAVLDDEDLHGCAVMNFEFDTTGNAGKFLPTDCNLALSRTFCEIPRSTLPVCADKSTGCPDALSNDAGFCMRDASYQVASLYCEQSCSNCQDYMVTCDEPTSATYQRTSAKSVVDAGEVMTFACGPGLFHTSGDLKRACGLDGNFLGDEPVCASIPIPQDIGVSGVMRRGKSSPGNLIHLLDDEQFRIPYNGIVSHWHFYGTKTGTIYFVVYRFNIATGTFTLVGYNYVTIAALNLRWTHTVPFTDRITVQEGDVYGFFTIGGEIAATSCINYPEQPMTLLTEPSNDLNGLYGTKDFAGTSCLIPSLGLRVMPW